MLPPGEEGPQTLLLVVPELLKHSAGLWGLSTSCAQYQNECGPQTGLRNGLTAWSNTMLPHPQRPEQGP